MTIVSISGGMVVGTALTSFLIILDIIPRLAQLTNNQRLSCLYEILLVLGSTSCSLFYLLDINFPLGNIFAVLLGSFIGIFVGLFTAALTEVLNVMPIMTKRLQVERYVKPIIVSIALGKMLGSIVFWFYSGLYG